MSTILQQLYSGELAPVERLIPRLGEHRAVWEQNFKNYEDFIQKLGSPLGAEFINIMEEQLDTCPFDLEQAFLEGFSLGAKMIIEIYQEPGKK